MGTIKINECLDKYFTNYTQSQDLQELKIQLSTDLIEKYQDLIQHGVSEELALQQTIDAIGDIDEIIAA